MSEWIICVIAGRERPVLSASVGVDIAHLASDPNDPPEVRQEIGLACWLVHVLQPEAEYPVLCWAMTGVKHHGRTGFESAMRVLGVTSKKEKAHLREILAHAMRSPLESAKRLALYRA